MISCNYKEGSFSPVAQKKGGCTKGVLRGVQGTQRPRHGHKHGAAHKATLGRRFYNRGGRACEGSRGRRGLDTDTYNKHGAAHKSDAGTALLRRAIVHATTGDNYGNSGGQLRRATTAGNYGGLWCMQLSTAKYRRDGHSAMDTARWTQRDGHSAMDGHSRAEHSKCNAVLLPLERELCSTLAPDLKAPTGRRTAHPRDALSEQGPGLRVGLTKPSPEALIPRVRPRRGPMWSRYATTARLVAPVLEYGNLGRGGKLRFIKNWDFKFLREKEKEASRGKLNTQSMIRIMDATATAAKINLPPKHARTPEGGCHNDLSLTGGWTGARRAAGRAG